ncbi:MAG TPA: hypothetical protein EYG18_05350 [Micavibrio sp.]|nr:hypothetical protein [Micavibrio sp.]HIL28675.1 hypothetical protein [Micavibrio sp.]
MKGNKTLSSVFALALLAAPAVQAESFSFGRASEYSDNGMYYSTHRITLDYVVGFDQFHYGTDIQIPSPDEPEFYPVVIDVLTDFLSIRPITALDDRECSAFIDMVTKISDESFGDLDLLLSDIGISPNDWEAATYKKFRFDTLAMRNAFLDALRSPYMQEKYRFLSFGPERIDEVNDSVQAAQTQYPQEPAFNARPLSYDDLLTLRQGFAEIFVYEMQNTFSRSDFGSGHGAFELEGKKIDAMIGGAQMLYPQYFSQSNDVVLYDGVMSRYEGQPDIEAMNDMMPDYLNDALERARMSDGEKEVFNNRVVEWLNYYDRRRVIPQPHP